MMLRDTWMKMAADYEDSVDVRFHMVLCKHEILSELINEEIHVHNDTIIHISPHPRGTRTGLRSGVMRTYGFCGPGQEDSEGHHRLQLYYYLMYRSSQRYTFVAFLDDDGLLCLPRLIANCRYFFPRVRFVSGKMWCNASWVDMNYFDEDFLLYSFDMLARIAIAINDTLQTRLQLLNQDGGEQRFNESQKQAMPFAIHHQHLVSSYIDQGEDISVFDNQEGIDSQQGTLNSMMYDRYAELEKGTNRQTVANEYWAVACAHGMWFHHVTRREVLEAATKGAMENKYMSPSPPNVSRMTSSVCTWSYRLILREFVNPECAKYFGDSAEEDWVQELCAHRYIFIRGQHHSGAGLLQELLTMAKHHDISSFSSQEEDVPRTPKVPDFEGLYLQEILPWDDAHDDVNLKPCFCKCHADPPSWLCMFFCPIQTQLSRSTARDLFASWRQFWDTGSKMGSAQRPKVLMEASSGIDGSLPFQFFPHVSFIIYIMRHPWASRFSFHKAACHIPTSGKGIPTCLADWILLWYILFARKQSNKTLVIRFEALLANPKKVLLQTLQTHLADIFPSGELHEIPADIWSQRSATPKLDMWNWHTTHNGTAAPHHRPDVLGMAAKCNRSSLCQASCSFSSSIQQAMHEFGYNLLQPEKSAIEEESAIVNLGHIFAQKSVSIFTTEAKKMEGLQKWSNSQLALTCKMTRQGSNGTLPSQCASPRIRQRMRFLEDACNANRRRSRVCITGSRIGCSHY